VVSGVEAALVVLTEEEQAERLGVAARLEAA